MPRPAKAPGHFPLANEPASVRGRSRKPGGRKRQGFESSGSREQLNSVHMESKLGRAGDRLLAGSGSPPRVSITLLSAHAPIAETD